MNLFDALEDYKQAHPEIQECLDVLAYANEVIRYYELIQIYLHPIILTLSDHTEVLI